jgi:hypothetical protein
MSREGQRLASYLDHILQAIERVHRYTEDMEEAAFSQSEMTQDGDYRGSLPQYRARRSRLRRQASRAAAFRSL